MDDTPSMAAKWLESHTTDQVMNVEGQVFLSWGEGSEYPAHESGF